MPRFRKLPVTIEAVQWTGSNHSEIAALAGDAWLDDVSPGDDLIVYTLEGEMRCFVGDWLIKGVKGEFYPCKPDIFVLTYDPV